MDEFHKRCWEKKIRQEYILLYDYIYIKFKTYVVLEVNSDYFWEGRKGPKIFWNDG